MSLDGPSIVAICGVLVAVVQVFNTWLLNRIRVTSMENSARNHAAILDVKHTVNGQMDDFKRTLKEDTVLSNAASFRSGQEDHALSAARDKETRP